MSISNQFLNELSTSDFRVLPATEELVKKVFDNKIHAEDYVNMLKEGDTGKFVFSNKNDDYIGHIMVKVNEHKHRELSVLFIQKKYRRSGYAQFLINLYPKLQVLYTEVDNKESQRLYTKLGWVNSGIKGHFDSKNYDHIWILFYKKKYIKIKELDVYEKGV